MATRVLSRRAMREQNDQNERTSGDESPPAEPKGAKTRPPRSAAAKPAKEKLPPKPRVRKPRVKIPPRMFARWAICDNGLKRLAVFEYKDRPRADAKLAELHERKPGTYFLQLVKDPFDPPVVPDHVITEPVTRV
jgi:hypothetical protein